MPLSNAFAWCKIQTLAGVSRVPHQNNAPGNKHPRIQLTYTHCKHLQLAMNSNRVSDDLNHMIDELTTTKDWERLKGHCRSFSNNTLVVEN